MFSSILKGSQTMIYRDNHNSNFTTVSNEVIRSELSDGAVRLLLFMLSCSDDWEFSVGGLAFALGWQKRKVERLVGQLKKFGYLVIKKNQDENGHFGSYDWDVCEDPNRTTNFTELGEKPNSVKNRTRKNTELGESPNSVKSVTITNNNTITNTNSIKTNTNSIGGHSPKFQKPRLGEIADYCKERGNQVDPQRFFDYYESNGWKVGKNPMKDWKATVRNWERNDRKKPEPIKKNPYDIDWSQI